MCGKVEDIRNYSASIPWNTEMEAPEGSDRPGSIRESISPDQAELEAILKEVNIGPVEKAFASPPGGPMSYPRGPIIGAFLSMPVASAKVSSFAQAMLSLTGSCRQSGEG